MKTLCAPRFPNRGYSRVAAAIVAIALIAFGTLRGLAQTDETDANKIRQTNYAALHEAPAKAQARKNPFEGDARAVVVGAKLFEQHCAECHGSMADGTRKGPTLLHEEVREATPGALFWLLTNGVVRKGMPVWSKLPEPQRWQLVTFLRSLNEPPENDRP